jgi:signal transduction histidine kinase
VIANLLDNALKYVPPARFDGGRITVTVSQVEVDGVAMGEIAVEDNGAGVPLKQQVELFKRFFRGDGQSDTSVDGGAGLGLAIVHDIMVLHGGSVHYEDAPEGGARFIVRMPLTTGAAGERDVSRRSTKKSVHHAPIDM